MSKVRRRKCSAFHSHGATAISKIAVSLMASMLERIAFINRLKPKHPVDRDGPSLCDNQRFQLLLQMFLSV